MKLRNSCRKRIFLTPVSTTWDGERFDEIGLQGMDDRRHDFQALAAVEMVFVGVQAEEMNEGPTVPDR